MTIQFCTQPDNSFASVYRYDEVNKVMYRARMELDRKEPSGNPGIFKNSNRIVLFLTENVKSNKKLTSRAADQWRFTNNKVTFKDVDVTEYTQMPNKNLENYFVYDFTYDNNGKTKTVHKGNFLTTDPTLPGGNLDNVVKVIKDLIKKNPNTNKIAFGELTSKSSAEEFKSYINQYKF